MHKVLLEHMVFHARHGVFEEESIIGGKFEVNLELTTDFTKSMNTDELDGTIDYSKVYEIVSEEIKIPSALLEHVAKRIINRIKTNFQTVETILLKISKLNPPISGEIGKVSIIIEE